MYRYLPVCTRYILLVTIPDALLMVCRNLRFCQFFSPGFSLFRIISCMIFSRQTNNCLAGLELVLKYWSDSFKLCLHHLRYHLNSDQWCLHNWICFVESNNLSFSCSSFFSYSLHEMKKRISYSIGSDFKSGSM
jgi:hypothetical protein